MAKDYSEDKLVQESTAKLLEELGWDSVFAWNDEVLGESNGTLGRDSYNDVILKRKFKSALKRLNPWMADDNLNDALYRMKEYMSTQTTMQINEQKHYYIRDGIPVTRKKPSGEDEEVRARIIDFDNPDNNEYTAVRELIIHGKYYNRRADVVCFVNGLPLVFIELKKHDVDVKDAYTRNYTDYRDTVPQLFYYNAFLIFSNGLQARVGTLESKWEFFHEWKRLKEEDEGSLEIETMLRGVCDKKNLLDLIENYILFDHSNGRINKILAKNHQFLGVNKAVDRYRRSKEMQELKCPQVPLDDSIEIERTAENEDPHKLGVFWHTQGSGKSYSMAFFSQKIRRKFEGSPTIVILTDRDELNNQICGIFENCGLLGKVRARDYVAQSGKDLKDKLNGNPSFIFTLIQKFNDANAAPLYPKHDVILISDEAHRTQNGIYAENMMMMLPTAYRIGFTGTPLLSDDFLTRRTFGGYVSVYDFQRAVDDHATVPLLYESRGDRIKGIKQPNLNEEIAAKLEEAEYNEEERERVEKQFAKEIGIIMSEKRLQPIAKDFVKHYSDLWTTGKAMFVCYNKVSCVRMYNFVDDYWKSTIKKLRKKIEQTSDPEEREELTRKLTWMEETDMAAVFSQEQNEIKTFRDWGLDVIPHRKRMLTQDLEKEFKDDGSKLRIVFVCAMWLTGFDVKSLSCLYIDKPMKAHTLMQTIARANRVAEGKTNGIIIDYIGIIKPLRKALADYTSAGKDGVNVNPVVDKDELIQNVRRTIDEGKRLLKDKGIELQDVIDASGFDRIRELRKAADALLHTVKARKTFQIIVTTLGHYWKYLDREDFTRKMKHEKDALINILYQIQSKKSHPDTSKLQVEIQKIVNEHLEIEENLVPKSKCFDISKINFDLLQAEFARTNNRGLVLKDIMDIIEERLKKTSSGHGNGVDFYDKYSKIIKEYNEEQDRVNIEKIFAELMALSNELEEEQTRYIREGFANEEQLRLFDILTSKEKPSQKDVKTIKNVATELLDIIQQKLSEMDHPFDKPATSAQLKTEIRHFLYNKMPEDIPDTSLESYGASIYEFISTRYAS